MQIDCVLTPLKTVWHIVSGCKKLAQREYRKRHDKVALGVDWELIGREACLHEST